MPLINVHTSEELSGDAAQALLGKLSRSLAELLGKPESYVMTCLHPRTPMTFGASSEPTCYAEIKNIGTLSPEQTKSLSTALSKILGEGLGVSPDRIYLGFTDVERHMWGWRGGTFA